ncbi:relaxase/mobilization nuclease domain-containing protein [Litorimonas sp.]|uniref:relaxase/mobilization nuclease domain-containing protein n=1 Tax=Litorimonas sp. TaxID=1892381 RepID=UPI003A8778E4
MAIIVGNQRGGARDLAVHLMKDENEHIELHEVRGFVSDTVMGALNEAYATSCATRCKKFLYSMSVNPPLDKQVSTSDFIEIIDEAESRLGLTGQPRVIVFHEKYGRRHAHCVFSRIDTQELKAVHIPFDHQKLMELSRDIFIERGWKMPEGLAYRAGGQPRRFTLAQWQQAKRAGKDAKAISASLQDAWAISDSKTSFEYALDERGYRLARGDRRGFVVIDHDLEVYSLSRMAKKKKKELTARLGKPETLPSVTETQNQIRKTMGAMLGRLTTGVDARAAEAQETFENKRKTLVEAQRRERDAFSKHQETKRIASNKDRQARFRRGLSGLWDHLRGEHRRIKRKNEREAYQEAKALQKAKDEMVWRHLRERRRIEVFKLRHAERAQSIQRQLEQDRQNYCISHGPEP